MYDLLETLSFGAWAIFFAIIIFQFFRSIRLVPTKSAFIVERLGKYHGTLGPGFHALFPFIDRVAFKVDLKEETIEVPPQDCFSKDEVNVEVDGVIYLSVTDPVKASYGVTDYRHAAMQLAQTTTRSSIGMLELDKTFEERDQISSHVVNVLDQAGESWGIRVHRYEIKNLTPPESVRVSMEKQVTAERDRRAILAKSEGEKQAMINLSEGQKTEMINLSEGEMYKQINEAQGKSEEIKTIAAATAASISKVASAVNQPSGESALKLQLSEKMFDRIEKLAKPSTRVIVPTNIADLHSWLQFVDLDQESHT